MFLPATSFGTTHRKQQASWRHLLSEEGRSDRMSEILQQKVESVSLSLRRKIRRRGQTGRELRPRELGAVLATAPGQVLDDGPSLCEALPAALLSVLWAVGFCDLRTAPPVTLISDVEEAANICLCSLPKGCPAQGRADHPLLWLPASACWFPS